MGMNKFEQMYQQKLKTPQEIAQNIKSGDVCACPAALAEPEAILHALTDRAYNGEIEVVEHHLMLSVRPSQYLDPEMAGKITHVAWFTSGNARKAVQEGRADYLPCFYYEVPRFWREHVEPDVFYSMVSPMDSHGYFTFGVGSCGGRAQLERAKLKFLEINPYMPRVLGDNIIHISEVDAVCESGKPLPNLPEPDLTEHDIKISEFVADRIPNGATIQLGIGAMPNAIGKKLTDKKDLGIHSEMFTDSMTTLIELGVVNNSKKNINKGKSVATFAIGSQKMYDFLHDNPSIHFAPVGYVNDPRIISQNDNVISVNACVEVDFLGQVCSESIGHKNISGTGGQLDFVRGANWSNGGRCYICTYSTAKNDTISKINPTLTPGAHVSTHKCDVDCIVTEYGVAELKGKTASQRAKALIAIAHPKFREELTHQAKQMNFMI
jgi:acyl-CoA hydrolase